MRQNCFTKISQAVIIVVFVCIQSSLQISLEEFVTLSPSQKDALDKLRSAVSSKLPHEYMRQDVYLMRWLREQEFDVAGATNRILKDVQWREENNIDHILEEDWSDLDHEYRVLLEGCDKEGRPVISIPVGDWDIRRAVVAGQSERLIRYFTKMFEEGFTLARKFQENGQNVTQGTVIFDLTNFNLAQQGCLRCIPIYFHILAVYEQHYPYFAHMIISVNTPEFALPIYDIFKGILSKHVTNILKILGRNKNKWQKFLFDEIGESQLSRGYGGQNAEPIDYADLRETDFFKFTCSDFDRIRRHL